MTPRKSQVTAYTSSLGKISKQHRQNQSRPRPACSITGCAATFSRFADLLRHRKSIHGPKTLCGHLGCEYATARVDKMKEYIKNKHCDTNKSIHRDSWNWGLFETQSGFEILPMDGGVANYHPFIPGEFVFERNTDVDIFDFRSYEFGI